MQGATGCREQQDKMQGATKQGPLPLPLSLPQPQQPQQPQQQQQQRVQQVQREQREQ